MATLEQTIQFTIDGILGETKRNIGEKGSPTDFTIAGQVFDTGNLTLADNYTALTVWDSGQGGMTAPSFIIVISNVDVYLELANTTPATDERLILKIKANAFCVIPANLIAGYANNTSRLDGAALVLNTDYGAITHLAIQNDGADLAGDATIRVVLIA
jgi:hypothetical protein